VKDWTDITCKTQMGGVDVDVVVGVVGAVFVVMAVLV
jgi:hypothetical protein